MRPDVIDLRAFYASRLGRVARELVRRRVRALWPDVRGQRVLGLGYATPFLRGFLDEAERVVAVMPADQGVHPWPPEGPGRVALAHDAELPLMDASFDRVLMVHVLETADSTRALLREAWRVLAPGGRLLVLVPNRLGLWARGEATPFGHGHPYSVAQLNALMRDNLFTPLQWAQCLFLPPGQSRLWLRWAHWLEPLGETWFPAVAGLLLVESAKQIYGLTSERPARWHLRPRLLPRPATLTGG